MEKLAREKIANQQKLVNLKKDSSSWDPSMNNIILTEQIVKVDAKPKLEVDHMTNGNKLYKTICLFFSLFFVKKSEFRIYVFILAVLCDKNKAENRSTKFFFLLNREFEYVIFRR